MTRDEAERLAVGDKVWTNELPPGERHVGEVIDLDYCAVKVRWDDGEIGVTHPDDMKQIHRVTPADGER